MVIMFKSAGVLVSESSPQSMFSVGAFDNSGGLLLIMVAGLEYPSLSLEVVDLLGSSSVMLVTVL